MNGFQGVLHLGELFEVSGDTLRPSVCNPEVDSCGLVGIGQTSNDNGILQIFALVMHSSQSSDLPHEVHTSVKLKKPRNEVQETRVRVWKKPVRASTF